MLLCPLFAEHPHKNPTHCPTKMSRKLSRRRASGDMVWVDGEVATGEAKLTENDPKSYKHGPGYVVTQDIEDIYARMDGAAGPPDQLPIIEGFMRTVFARAPSTEKELLSAMSAARKQHKMMPRRSQLLSVLTKLRSEIDKVQFQELRSLLVKKASKSQSGVLVITVLTSPYPTVNGKTQKFSCAWNCYYCPNEPDQPRSYLHDEPAVKRANENGFDAVLQVRHLPIYPAAPLLPSHILRRAPVHRPRGDPRDERPPSRQDRAPRPRWHVVVVSTRVPGV